MARTTDEPTDAWRGLIYQEGCRAVALFIDWRHKVIVLCTATVGLTFAGVTWAYKEGAGPLAMAGALIAGSAVSGLCVRFDRRNEELLTLCYATVTECETAFCRSDGDATTRDTAHVPEGAWSRIVANRNSKIAAREKPAVKPAPAMNPALALHRRGRERIERWIPGTWGQLVPWAAGLLSRVFLAGALVCIALAIVHA